MNERPKDESPSHDEQCACVGDPDTGLCIFDDVTEKLPESVWDDATPEKAQEVMTGSIGNLDFGVKDGGSIENAWNERTESDFFEEK